MQYNELSQAEKNVIEKKGTEPPYSGEYDSFFCEGTYICRKCNLPLFSSESKFNSGCGWPSFDENYQNNVKRIPDSDGERTEITCSNCGGHLGHVFLNEGLTPKDTRHCVNSLSIKFVPISSSLPEVLYEN